jgi:hypothetical protein
VGYAYHVFARKMSLLLNPLLEGLDAARRAAPDAIRHDDEVTVDDLGDHWVFEFTPRDTLGGGARVSVAKEDCRILSVIRGQ